MCKKNLPEQTGLVVNKKLEQIGGKFSVLEVMIGKHGINSIL